MLHTRLSRLLLLSFGVVALAAAGCGPGKGVTLTGKLVPPKGVQFKQTDNIEVAFVPKEAKQRGTVVNVKADDLSFTSNTGDNAIGLLPGSYKVTVKVTPYAGEPGSADRARLFTDNVNKKYEPDTTPLTYEVSGNEAQNVTIDMTQNKVTKN